jgi:hypothetical protein
MVNFTEKQAEYTNLNKICTQSDLSLVTFMRIQSTMQ